MPKIPAKNKKQFKSVVRKYWENVPGAIAYLKEALRTWKKVNSPEKVFVVACKEGRKPESGAVVKSGARAWYEWARKQRLVIACQLEKGIVYSPNGETLKIEEMMAKYPMEV
ncbi:hypothetical protein DP117_32575 [Brasilonema sp. UFV-L1]|nr:hypothetical protein [Brasilonema sp. UFV-L1]